MQDRETTLVEIADEFTPFSRLDSVGIRQHDRMAQEYHRDEKLRNAWG